MNARSLVKRLVMGGQADPRIEWPRLLDGRVRFGDGTKLNGAKLAARAPQGCSLEIGSRSNIEGSLVFEKSDAAIVIGSRTHIGGGTLVAAAARIEIGDDVLLAFDVLVMDHNSHAVRFAQRQNDVTTWIQGEKDWSHVAMAPVRILNKSWIGARSIILKGVTVGEGGIVAAGSVVTSDVPPWTIVGGNPARLIRELTDDERTV
jgi:acetyltransferase-like isoleucine patch superfamily enzyme